MKKNILALLLISMLSMNQGASAVQWTVENTALAIKGGTCALAVISSLVTALSARGVGRSIYSNIKLDKKISSLEDGMMRKKLDEAYGATCSEEKKQELLKELKKLKKKLSRKKAGTACKVFFTGGSAAVTALLWVLFAAVYMPKDAYGYLGKMIMYKYKKIKGKDGFLDDTSAFWDSLKKIKNKEQFNCISRAVYDRIKKYCKED